MISSSFLHEYSGMIGGAVGTVATTLSLMLKQWWEDRKFDRAINSEQKTREELINMIREDLTARQESEKRNSEVLTRLAISIEGMVGEMRHSKGKTMKPQLEM